MEPVSLLEVNDVLWWFLEEGYAQRRSVDGMGSESLEFPSH